MYLIEGSKPIILVFCRTYPPYWADLYPKMPTYYIEKSFTRLYMWFQFVLIGQAIIQGIPTLIWFLCDSELQGMLKSKFYSALC